MADTKTVDSRLIPNIQYSTPNTGDTVNVGTAGYTILLLNPSGTLATLTINLPSSPQTGDQIIISTSQIITALSISNGTIIGTLTSLVLGGFAEYIYHATANKWFRVG